MFCYSLLQHSSTYTLPHSHGILYTTPLTLMGSVGVLTFVRQRLKVLKTVLTLRSLTAHFHLVLGCTVGIGYHVFPLSSHSLSWISACWEPSLLSPLGSCWLQTHHRGAPSLWSHSYILSQLSSWDMRWFHFWFLRGGRTRSVGINLCGSSFCRLTQPAMVPAPD